MLVARDGSRIIGDGAAQVTPHVAIQGSGRQVICVSRPDRADKHIKPRGKAPERTQDFSLSSGDSAGSGPY
jgi:hypothetical protein